MVDELLDETQRYPNRSKKQRLYRFQNELKLLESGSLTSLRKLEAFN